MPAHFHIAIGLVLLPYLVPGQQTSVNIDHLSYEEGLPHRWITDIEQDEKGHLWISTFYGLTRYNGQEMITFNQQQEGAFNLPIDQVSKIYKDQKGHFWLVTTKKQQPVIFDPLTFNWHIAASDTSQMLRQLVDSSFLRLQQIDFSKYILGKARYQSAKKIFQQEGLDLSPANNQIWVYPSGTLTVLEGNTYYYLNSKALTLKKHRIQGKGKLPVDIHNQLWYPHPYRDTALVSIQLPDGLSLKSFLIDNAQGLWMLDSSNISFKMDTSSGEAMRIRQLPKSGAEVLYQDKEGICWMATQSGLVKISIHPSLFQKYGSETFAPDAIPPISNSPRAIVQASDGTLYTSMWSHRGLYLVEENSRNLLRVEHPMLPTKPIMALLSSGKHIWGVSRNKVFRYRPSDHSVRILPQKEVAGHIRSLFPGPEAGKMIIGLSGNAVRFFDTAKWTLTPPVMLEDQDAEYHFAVKGDKIFSNAQNGVVIHQLDGRKVKYIELLGKPMGLPPHIRCHAFEGNSLWLGTSQGLFQLDTVNWEVQNHLTVEDGLPNSYVYSMLLYNEHLWLGTQYGLCRYHLPTGRVRNFFPEDGLSHYEFNSNAALISRDGRLWMGTINGFNAFYPEQLLKAEKWKPELVLSHAKIYNEKTDSSYLLPLHGQPDLNVGPHERSFSFNFALLSLSKPANNQYSYYLEGLEPAWSNSGNATHADYRQVPAGQYTLRIRAFNHRGIPAAEEIALPVHVQQYWYLRWWALLLWGILAAGALVAVARIWLWGRLEKAESQRLKELDQFKNRFFTNITHEFRTPLTVILGASEELSQSATSAEEHRKLKLLQRSGTNLLRLINQILDLSKLESNHLQLHYVQGDVLAYLRYIAESLHSLANAQNVILRVESPHSEIVTDYEPERLLQVVHNLLSNAIKFTPSGGRVLLTAEQPGQQLLISVKDTGCGIAPEDLPHIFDRFYQAQNQEQSPSGGSGIGLALSRELVRAMHGEISVDSQPGRGSTFTLRLPATRQAAKLKEALPSGVEFVTPFRPEMTATPAAGDSSRPILLLVEDNPDVVEYLADCLGESFQLHFAYNGRAGLEQALAIVPDIIISDVMMPEMDGYAFCTQLRNDERINHIPFILLTAKADAESRLKGLERGADAYLAKPFNKKELLLRLQNLLDQQKRIQDRYARQDFGEFPPQHNPSSGLQPEDTFIQKATEAILNHLDDASFGNAALARTLTMSESQLNRKIKALTSKTLSVFIRSVRLQQGRKMLQYSDRSVSEVAYAVGFRDPAYFSRTFSQEFGHAPSQTPK